MKPEAISAQQKRKLNTVILQSMKRWDHGSISDLRPLNKDSELPFSLYYSFHTEITVIFHETV